MYFRVIFERCLCLTLWRWANPEVLDVTPEGFDQVYLPNSDKFVDDMMISLYSQLGGRIQNEKRKLQILVMNS